MTWDEARSLAEGYIGKDIYLIFTYEGESFAAYGTLDEIDKAGFELHSEEHGIWNVTNKVVVEKIIPKGEISLRGLDKTPVEIEYKSYHSIPRYHKAYGVVDKNAVVVEGSIRIAREALITVHPVYSPDYIYSVVVGKNNA
jgi:hypothetical protein